MNIQEYIQEYGVPPPGLEGYGHHNPVHALKKHVRGMSSQESISGYQNPNQHHNGHHDGQGLEGYNSYMNFQKLLKSMRQWRGNKYTKAKGEKCSKNHECRSNQCNFWWDTYNGRGYKICE